MRTEETITNEMMTNDKFYEEIDDLLDRQSGLVIDDLLKYNNKEFYMIELKLLNHIRTLLKEFYNK